MKKIRFICGCGGENYNREDWLSHWKYGYERYSGKYRKIRARLRALYLFFTTRVELK